MDAPDAALEILHGGGHGGDGHDAGVDVQLVQCHAVLVRLVDDPFGDVDFLLRVGGDAVPVTGQTHHVPRGPRDQGEDGLALVTLFVDGVYHAGAGGVTLFQNPR